MAAQGEVPIGMTLDLPILQYKRQNYPVELIWPSEGTGSDLDSNGLIRGAKNAKADRRFLDWAISPSAMTEIAKLKVTVPYPGIRPVGDIPSEFRGHHTNL
jgi:iron(III) transport system substrate-binding protein